MSIPVTCLKCHTRFNVSEKFAGQKGPCPKCKEIIQIPTAEEEVVIAAPKAAGPVDTQGRSVLKPIKRKENTFTTMQIAVMASSLVGIIVAALLLLVLVEDKLGFPVWPLIVAAVLIAPTIVYGGYMILKDQELQPFQGKELWTRVLIASAIYALLWLAFPVAKYAFGDHYDTGSWMVALGGMLAAGGAAGMLTFDFDYTMGLIHYGIYLGLCLLCRVIAGIGVFPGMLEPENAEPTIRVTGSLDGLSLLHPSGQHLEPFFAPMKSLLVMFGG